MLKTVHPLLNSDLLYALRQMGHGEDLIISDSNFPAEGIAAETTFGRVLRLDADAATAVKVILSQFPLDTFVDDAACRMEVVGKPNELLPIHNEVQKEIDAAEGGKFKLVGVERFAFYEKAKKAYAVVQTSERRFYGCFIFKMGVISPDQKF
ncbi:RbsD/FucU family protein [Aestuariivirga litoralis]|uniref:RbsD/FucU family protein n=1 Tax=Aestuariivirga litoralis TaxID=2650924 RepID=UPI0018C5D037|nr:RbsD/FucU domain-containing protein [Aestuariivirga litoralis]MBG1233320.1 ribose ABC transporter [Aestuariivirga litoralis]